MENTSCPCKKEKCIRLGDCEEFTILGFAVYGYSMIAIGFGQGLTPLASVCWGAKEQKTAMELHGMTNRILFAIGVLFAVFCFIFEKQAPFLKAAASKRALKRVALANRRREGVQIPPVTAERRLASMK